MMDLMTVGKMVSWLELRQVETRVRLGVVMTG